MGFRRSFRLYWESPPGNGAVERVGHTLGGDKAPVVVVVIFGEGIGLEDSVDVVVGGDKSSYELLGVLQHREIALKVGLAGERAVTGDDLGLIIGEFQQALLSRDKSVYTPSAVQINIGEKTAEECISGVNNIGRGENDDRVAVGVCVRRVDQSRRLIVEVKLHLFGEGDHG